MDDRPLVVACLAPDDLQSHVDPSSGEVAVDERRCALSAPDAAALEYALRVGEAWNAKVLALAVGPAQVEGALEEARALGVDVRRIASHEADSAKHGGGLPGDDISYPGGQSGGARRVLSAAEIAGDPSWVARQLATEIRRSGHLALVLCGDRSTRYGLGAVPGLLAAELGLPQALGLVSLEFCDGATLSVERRLDGGWRERILVDRAAVLSVEAAGVRLRKAGLEAVLAVAGTAVTTVPATAMASRLDIHFDLPLPYRPRASRVEPPLGDAHQRLVAITGSQLAEMANRVVGPLSPSEAADELVCYLTQHGYLKSSP